MIPVKDKNHLTHLPISFGHLRSLQSADLCLNQIERLPDNLNQLHQLELLNLRRPEHLNNRQSPSPSSVNNDQNYNDRAQLPDDQVQDALGTFFYHYLFFKSYF